MSSTSRASVSLMGKSSHSSIISSFTCLYCLTAFWYLPSPLATASSPSKSGRLTCLTVAPGVLAYGEKKNIVLTAFLPDDGKGAGITSEYAVLEVRQPSVLDSIVIQLPEGFEAKVDETILLADFIVNGYDQYGNSFDPGNVVWQSDSPVIEIKNNAVLILKAEDTPANITATVQDVTSNTLEITAAGTPRLSTITLSGVPQKCDYNSTIDLTTLTAQQKDQYGNTVEIPSAVVWAIANNASSAVITGNVLNTGNTRGTVTLTASVGPAIKSSSTIFVGTNVTEVSVSAATMSSSAGNDTISLSGDFLGHDVTVGLFKSDNNTPILTVVAQDGSAIIPVPTNQTSSAIEYEVKISYDGTAYESAPTAAITVNKKSSSGGGGGGGSSSPIVTAKPEPTTQPEPTVKPEPTTQPEAPAESTKPSIDSFSDVSPDDWFYDAGTFVIEQGLFSGISETEFAPNDNMSRAMLVTVLFRMADQPQSGEPGFADVSKDEWYAGAVSWASENGIVSGSGNNEFAPNREITREETAVILYKFAKSQGIDVSASSDLSTFADDNEISDWAGEAMHWAISTGLISGKGNGIIDPKGKATRAENAVILQRFINHAEQKKQ